MIHPISNACIFFVFRFKVINDISNERMIFQMYSMKYLYYDILFHVRLSFVLYTNNIFSEFKFISYVDIRCNWLH